MSWKIGSIPDAHIRYSHNDRVRLQELKTMDAYAKVINYMLAQDVKLEQEIVSLTLMERG